jgi:hypothetical protein
MWKDAEIYRAKKESFSENMLIIRDIYNAHCYYMIKLTNSEFTLTGIKNKN